MAATENLRCAADFVTNITRRLRGISIDDTCANELFDLPSLLIFSSDTSTDSRHNFNINANTFNWIIKRIIIRTRVLWPEPTGPAQDGEVFAEESQLLAADWNKLTDSVGRFRKFDLMLKSNQIDIFVDTVCRAVDLGAPVLQSIEIRAQIVLFCLVTVSVLANEEVELSELVEGLAKLTARVILTCETNDPDISAFVNGALQSMLSLSPFEAVSGHNQLHASKLEEHDELHLWSKLLSLLTTFFQKSRAMDLKMHETTLLLPQTSKKSIVQISFLDHLLKHIFASTSAASLRISSSLSQLTECIQSNVGQKNIQTGYNFAFLSIALKVLLRIMKRSSQSCFFSGRVLCEAIKGALCKSPAHFQVLYSSYLKLMRFIYNFMEDQDWLRRHWETGDMSNHLTTAYTASVKPNIDYITNNSAKQPQNKSDRLNTTEKLVCEVEIMTLKPELREQLLIQFIKLLTLLLTKNEIGTECTQWTADLSKFARNVISNGATFKNLSQKASKEVARFLTQFSENLRRTDAETWNKHKYSLLDFALTRLGGQGKELQETLCSSARSHQLLIAEPILGSPSVEMDPERYYMPMESRREFTFGLESKVISVDSDSQSNNLLTKTVANQSQNNNLFFTFSLEKKHSLQQRLSSFSLSDNLTASQPTKLRSFKRVKTTEAQLDSTFFKSVIESTAKKDK